MIQTQERPVAAVCNVRITARNRVMNIDHQRQYPSVDAATEVFERLKKPEFTGIVASAVISADIYIDDIYEETVIIDAFERAYPKGDIRQ